MDRRVNSGNGRDQDDQRHRRQQAHARHRLSQRDVGPVSSEALIALPPEADLIVGLLAPQGFAVAFSSFSQNGWAVKDGAQLQIPMLMLSTSRDPVVPGFNET